jgi:flagellar basal-body rod protein FlgG
VGTSANLAISPEGVLSRNGTTLATLNVVSLTNPVQQGDTLFAGTAGARPAGTAVRQGYLESSGVDPTTAMVDMLNTLRTYQSDEQAIQTINQTLSAGIQAGGL